jgi:hydrogenase-4 component B
MGLPMGLLALFCVLLGVWPLAAVGPVLAAGTAWLGSALDPTPVRIGLLPLLPAFAVLACLIFALSGVQRLVIRGVGGRLGTWDCGYADPTSRMQYRSSFGGLISGWLPRFFAPFVQAGPRLGIFPAKASFETTAPDPLEVRLYEPLVLRWAKRFERVRWLQQGRLTLYLVYIFLAMIATLVWSVARPYVT